MDLNLTGKRALVTGASSGLGLGCARALAAEGARVVMVARGVDRLEVAAAGIPGAIAIAADVVDASDRDEMLDRAEAELGGIDILIANAGGPPHGTFATTEFDLYRTALEQNLLSSVAMCTRLIPPMRERAWGRVVAITSVTVREPSPTLILSNTARAGLTAFLKTTAREVAADGVTVNSLQPGMHRTPRLEEVYADIDAAAAHIPAQRLGDPDDFGRVAAFLCSDSAKFITGAAIPLDGGASHSLQ